MSGASAGAISLGILLPCLVDYKFMIKTAGFKNKAEILKQIEKDYRHPDILDLD